MDRNEGAPDLDDDVNVPGCAHLREAVAARVRSRRLRPGNARDLMRDGVAGATVTVSQVPDALAQSALIGVNPLYGLHAAIVAPIVGAILSRRRLMVVSTTSAAALVAAQALAGVPETQRASSLFLMLVVAGLVMMTFGLLRLGRLTRFVSFSVMTGFLAGIALLLVLSQIPVALGHAAAGGSVAERTLSLARDPAGFDPASALLAGLTLAIALVVGRTRLANFAPLLGVVVATLLAVLLQPDVALVADVGDIRGGIPTPHLPSPEHLVAVLGGALSISAVVLVQGAGVSQSLPREAGHSGGLSRDFISQGAANVVAGIFRGIPVGASLGASAINFVGGATSRKAAMFAGIWMLLVVLALSSIVARVPMPALGALLILAGLRALRPADIRAVYDSGAAARLAGAATFLSTLILPLVAAVAIGVVLAALLHLVRSAGEVTVVELTETEDGRIREKSAPRRLDEPRAVVLDVYGDLFYAGARALERLLPEPGKAERPVVVLRLRAQRSIGSTLADVLGDYSDALTASGGRLYLAGVTDGALRQLAHSRRFRMSGPTLIYPADSIRGVATRRALEDADAWLLEPSIGRARGPSS